MLCYVRGLTTHITTVNTVSENDYLLGYGSWRMQQLAAVSARDDRQYWLNGACTCVQASGSATKKSVTQNTSVQQHYDKELSSLTLLPTSVDMIFRFKVTCCQVLLKEYEYVNELSFTQSLTSTLSFLLLFTFPLYGIYAIPHHPISRPKTTYYVYFVTLWKKEWLENLRETREGYTC